MCTTIISVLHILRLQFTNLSLSAARVCHVTSGHEILKYFRPITHKKDTPEDKDLPEGKELSYLLKVISSSS